MTTRYLFLTHTDRVVRRQRILALLEKGSKAREVAERYGMSANYVRAIGREAGIPMVDGRTVKLIHNWPECPEHLRKDWVYLTKRKGLKPDEARAVLLPMVNNPVAKDEIPPSLTRAA